MLNGGDFDYIIVGSGAGGGPLAANLAKSGFKVLLLEAGGDSCSECDAGRLMYEVPIFHGLSTEYGDCAWNYFVRHYSDTAQQQRDSKFIPEKDGVWYPRAGTLGGCTAHNAMITVVPQDSDWNYIAQITGDTSWHAEKMHGYFERLENCTYVTPPGSLDYDVKGVLSSIAEILQRREDWRDWSHGHGFKGWLTTSETDPRLVLKDPGNYRSAPECGERGAPRSRRQRLRARGDATRSQRFAQRAWRAPKGLLLLRSLSRTASAMDLASIC